jgi:hypothetical protein
VPLTTALILALQAPPARITDGAGALLAASVIAAVVGALATVVAARYGWLGKAREGETARLAQEATRQAARLTELEARDARCQDRLFKLRTIVGTLVLKDGIYSRLCPEAAEEAADAQEKLMRQLREFDVMDEAEDVHSTSSPPANPARS